MENLSTYSFPKTVHGYMGLLFDHRAKVNDTPSPWPGDQELLAAYNVTPSDILKSVVEKINQAEIPQKIAEAKSLENQDALIETTLNDHYKITASFKSIPNTLCTYCKVDLISQGYFKIYNLMKEIELVIPEGILHLLEHNDLGDTLELHIDPTIACNALELGNTTLETSNPLYNVAQFGKRFYIEQSLS